MLRNECYCMCAGVQRMVHPVLRDPISRPTAKGTVVIKQCLANLFITQRFLLIEGIYVWKFSKVPPLNK